MEIKNISVPELIKYYKNDFYEKTRLDLFITVLNSKQNSVQFIVDILDAFIPVNDKARSILKTGQRASREVSDLLRVFCKVLSDRGYSLQLIGTVINRHRTTVYNHINTMNFALKFKIGYEDMINVYEIVCEKIKEYEGIF